MVKHSPNKYLGVAGDPGVFLHLLCVVDLAGNHSELSLLGGEGLVGERPASSHIIIKVSWSVLVRENHK